jgi:hypothetical protein
MNMNFKKSDKLAVELKDGSILIGYILDSSETLPFINNNNLMASLIDDDAIWLRRQSHVSYLSKDTIKKIRKANPFETEIN